MQQILKFISQQYSLMPLNIHEKITRGVLSQNHIISDGTKHYFLKRWRYTDHSRVQEINRIEEFFSANKIPVILPLFNIQNEQAVRFQNNLYSLYPYVQEKHIEREALDGPALESMAKLLAKIHLISRTNKIPVQKYFTYWDKEKKIAKIQEITNIIDNIKNKTTYDLTAAEYLARKRTLIEKNKVQLEDLNLASDTLIHGDYHESNLFFTNNQASHVFDLEKAEMAPRPFELIRCIELTLLNGEYTNHNLRRAAHFIATYNQIYPISSDEIRQALRLRYIKSMHDCWIEEAHYLNNDYRPDIFIEIGLKSLLYHTEHLEDLTSILTNPEVFLL